MSSHSSSIVLTAAQQAGYSPPDLSLPAGQDLVYSSRVYLASKRMIDLLLSVLFLPLALLLTVLIAALIKLTGRGPVFFRQLRAGKDGEPFWCLKFRTMVVGADGTNARESLEHMNMTNGPTFKVPNDPRVTSLGRFLRRSSLDELPQLFHVLSGKMSMVGPRPLPIAEVCDKTVAERVRLLVKPGLTGLWQVSGRSEIPYNEWVALDAYYARHRSTLLDLQILLQTIPAVLSARGAY
ncbi:MAG: sugar transferase [Phycisphaerae bacterium]|nr:sugar transferase [Phycisphaerae bacterium]